MKLADAIEANIDEIAAVEVSAKLALRYRPLCNNRHTDWLTLPLSALSIPQSTDNGKAFAIAKGFDIAEVANCLRYYGGWADKRESESLVIIDITRVLNFRADRVLSPPVQTMARPSKSTTRSLHTPATSPSVSSARLSHGTCEYNWSSTTFSAIWHHC